MKSSKERCLLGQKHSLQIFGVNVAAIVRGFRAEYILWRSNSLTVV